MLTLITFYPTLAYNLLRNLIQPNTWCWYNRVDDNVIVGALPFKSMTEELKVEFKNENVGGIVCCTEEFEMKAAFNYLNDNECKKINIKFYHIPMQDFFGTAAHQDVKEAVEFVDKIVSEGKTCYIHCKAGRTRSATIAACYLIKKYNYMPNIALEHLKQKRRQIILQTSQWRMLNEYRRLLDEKN